MTPAQASPAWRHASGALALRLLATLILIFSAAAVSCALVASRLIESARTEQLRDAGAHFTSRLRGLDAVWSQNAFALGQQLELWQIGHDKLTEDEGNARIRALLGTVLDQWDFTHAAIVDGAGRLLLRQGTRTQQDLDLPQRVDAAGRGWVYGASDRTVYRVVTGAVRYADQPARLLLYVPLDNALLNRLTYPSTRLLLMNGGDRVAASAETRLAPGASAPRTRQSAVLSLPWDAEPGAPVLEIERQYAAPLTLRELLLTAAAGAAAFIVAGWLVLGRWIRSQSRRLNTLQAVASEFAAAPALPSDLGSRLNTVSGTPDDIGILAKDLRTMMERVERARSEQALAAQALAKLNAELEDRVAERTRELAQARDVAVAAAGAKERFLSNMSHEIRTPMNGMLGALDLLAGTTPTPTQSRYIEVAATSGEALLAIINDVLDYSKIGAGKLELASEPIDVNAIARSVTTLFSAAAQRKALALKLHLDLSLSGWRLGDALRLRQVLMNLVGNALKFTPHGEIAVTTQRVGGPDGTRVAFEVSDTGVGIDPLQHASIFEAFFQTDGPQARSQAGTGLGLAISRELVHAMGGELTVQSVPGQGSTFRFEADLPAASPVIAASSDAAHTTAGHAADGLLGRVLLVEDNSVNRLVGAAMLEQLGLQVVLAEHGEEALAVLNEQPVNLVLMDCQMPVMDGYEATQRLREIERNGGRSRLPVIALTANALSGDFDRCLAAGMDAYLSKPYTRAQLHATLAPWLSRRTDLELP